MDGQTDGAPRPRDDVYLALTQEAIDQGIKLINFQIAYPWAALPQFVYDAACDAMKMAGRGNLEPGPRDLLLATQTLFAAAAACATTNPREALAAIGWTTKNRSRAQRFDAAAAARLNKDSASGKHWAAAHRREVEQLIAQEVFLMYEYGQVPPLDVLKTRRA